MGLWAITVLFGAVLISAAYWALPLAWKHYEHRHGLEGRTMVTTTRQGIPGDPINYGLVGTGAEIVCAFHAAGWWAANPVTLGSSLKIAGSVVLRRPYPAAPVSPLYYDQRPEDLAFEKADGPSASRRHHVRLWRTATPPDATGDPRPLWLASASYDKGVGVSHYTLRVTHNVDPDLDKERGYLAQSMSTAGLVASAYEVSGIGPTLSGRNGGGDRYYTDGEVIVQTLRANCTSDASQPASRLPNPWLVHVKNQLWRTLHPALEWIARQ